MGNTQLIFHQDVDIDSISNILFLHGLESSPEPKAKYLKELFPKSQIIAPSIDYKNDTIKFNNHSQKGIMDFCENTIHTMGINFIVGSSAGGRLGFILKEKYDLHYVLFNPALFSDKEEISWLEINRNLNNYKGLIVSGRSDEVVPLRKLVRFLTDNKYIDSLFVIDIAHNVPEDAFKKGVMQSFNMNINKSIQAYNQNRFSEK